MGRLKRKDLTGQRFGRLTAVKINRVQTTNNCVRTYWECICDCGKTKIIRTDCLTSGKTQSCGCYNKEKARVNLHREPKPFDPRKRHKLYRVYWAMRERCCNPNDKAYKYYGARGVQLCEEWLIDYCNFYDWATNNGYEEGLSIDRIDVDGDYCPENCRWTTTAIQARNTTRNVLYTINGVTKTLTDWCIEYGANRVTVNSRLTILGWDIERALTTPPDTHKKRNLIIHKSNDVKLFPSIKTCATFFDIRRETLRDYIKRHGLPCEYKGWTIEEATLRE